MKKVRDSEPNNKRGMVGKGRGGVTARGDVVIKQDRVLTRKLKKEKKLDCL